MAADPGTAGYSKARIAIDSGFAGMLRVKNEDTPRLEAEA
jgi:hypothetical protein